jgi:hypothetical protein
MKHSHPVEVTFTPGIKDRGRISTGDSLTFLAASAIQEAGKNQFGGSNEQIAANFFMVCKQFPQLFQTQLLIGYAIPGQHPSTIRVDNIRLLNLRLRKMALDAKIHMRNILTNAQYSSTLSVKNIQTLMQIPVSTWSAQSFIKNVDNSKGNRDRKNEIQQLMSLDIESLKSYFKICGVRSGMSNLKSNYCQSASIVGGVASRIENIWGCDVKVGHYLSLVLKYDDNGIPEFVPCVSESPTPPLDELATNDTCGFRTQGALYRVGRVLEVLRDVEITKDEDEMKIIQGRKLPDTPFEWLSPSPSNLTIEVYCGPPVL